VTIKLGRPRGCSGQPQCGISASKKKKEKMKNKKKRKRKNRGRRNKKRKTPPYLPLFDKLTI
jgi:hypothetical protein